MKLVFKVTGAAELANMLRQIQPEVVNRVVGKGLRAAAQPILSEMRSRTPVRTGALRCSLGITTTRPKKGYASQFALIGSKGLGYILRFLEFGTSRQAAHPIVRPAFDTRRATAEKVLVAELAKGIDEVTRGLDRKRKK